MIQLTNDEHQRLQAAEKERDSLRALIEGHNREQLKACGQAYCGEPDGNLCNDCPRHYHIELPEQS